MPAIPSELIHRLHETLARCSALESDRALRAVFIDASLAPWIDCVPENTATRAARVNALILALSGLTAPNGDNVLILFLRVLSGNTPAGDALREQLAQLADELRACPPAALTDLALLSANTSTFAQIGQQVGQQINAGHVVLNISQPAPQSSPIPYQTLNPPQPFIDRAMLRELLNAHLCAGGAHLLCGIGGVGKTALALRVAHDLMDVCAFPDGVLWIPLEGAPTAEMAATWIIAAYGLRGEADPLGALAGLLHTCRPLLILDNAEAAKATADALLARRGNATVLVTSRDVTVGFQSISGVPIDLVPLETDDAIALLRAHLGEIPASDHEAATLSNLVGGLPLALTLAAAFITRRLRRERDPLAAYLALLRRTPLSALELGDRRDTSVRIAFDLSWQVLDPTAQAVLGALALIPGDSADAAALQFVLQTEASTLELALWQLNDDSLLIQTADRYSLHPLLRLYARQRLSQEQADACWVQLRRYYLNFAKRAAGADDYGATLELERDNILGAMAMTWESAEWTEVIAFGAAVAFYLQLRGYWQLGYERAAWRLHAARQLQDDQEIANALSSLGDVHLSLDEYGEARGRYEEALPLYRAIGDRLGEANALSSLGDVHLGEGDEANALLLYQQAADLYHTLGLPNDEANALNRIADVYTRREDHPAALSWYTRALGLAPNNPMWYRNRALLYLKYLHDADAARMDLDRAVFLQPDHPYLALRRGDLAILEQNYPQALIEYQAFIAALPRNPAGYYGLGLAHLAAGDPQAALTTYTQALALTTDPHDTQEALKDLQALLTCRPDLPGIQAVLGLLSPPSPE